MTLESPSTSQELAGERPSLAGRLRSHPVPTAIGVVLVLAAVAVVLVWFQPQALLFDTVVEEDFPTVDPSAADTGGVGGQATDPGATNEQGADDASMDDDGTDEPMADATADTTDDTVDGSVDESMADSDDDRADDMDGEDVAAPTEPVALAAGGFSSRSRYTVTGDAVAYELPDGSRTLRLEDFESTNGPDLYVYLAAGDAADDDATLGRDTIDLGVLRGNVGSQNYDIPDDVDLEHYDTVVIWCLRFTVGFGAADLAEVVTG